jgi:hypothetical protein
MFGSKGEIDIAIQKTSFAPGDTISGNVVLTLKKPVKAEGVSISLMGEAAGTRNEVETGKLKSATVERQIRSLEMSGSETATVRWKEWGRSTRKAYVPFCAFKQQLDDSREYGQGQERYSFEIGIAADVLSKPLRANWTWPDGQEVVVSPSQIKWYLLAKLDIPHGLDISKKVELKIG